MVKRTVFLLLIILLILPFYFSVSESSEAGSFNDLVIGSPPDDAGKLIATRGGWKTIEFWHYSGGYCHNVTDNGKKK